jgi:raffinose/stachyose/melibiose transport system substrate-binding protein
VWLIHNTKEKKMKHRSMFLAAALVTILSIVLLACAPTAAPAPAPAPAATTAPAATSAPAATEASAAAPVTLNYLVDDSQNSQDTAKALAEAYAALHPNVTINVESRPGGTEGDNIVKTRLATGDMSDIFWYNSGSLLQALNPSETLVDISQEPFMANVVESFIPTVSQNGQVFGVPTGTALGGGILYNKKIYQDLGLSVPKTWEEFAANNEKIKAAGIAPVLATYGGTSTWTSQLFVLADYCNVQQALPNFAADYTANKVKYATSPEAMKGFEYLQEGNEKGWYQQDYATTTFEQGLQMLADGEGAHYPMLSFALSTIATNTPDMANEIGFFGQPGGDASTNCATIWMPAGTYIPKTTQNLDVAKDFLAFIASPEGVDAINAKVPPQGPYLIKGTELPDNVLAGVKDVAGYIDSGITVPALEFLSPVKGPSLEQITVATGSGQMTPAEAAAAYDQDVEKQAKQLGLPGW